MHVPAGSADRLVEFRTRPEGVYVVLKPGASAIALEEIVARALAERLVGIDVDALSAAWTRSDGVPALVAAPQPGAASLDTVLRTSEANGEVYLVIDPAARPLTLSDVVSWLNRGHFSGLDLDLIRQALKLPRGMPHRITRLCSDAPLPPVPLVAARRVLLVAVDARALGAVAALATRRGLDIRYASGVEMAIFEATQRLPDFVVIDLSLGASNVLSACRQLAADPRTAAIPVVLACKHVTRLFVSQALQAGVRDLMVHPIANDVLTRKLTRALEGVGKKLADKPGTHDALDEPPVLGRVELARLLDSSTPLHGIPAVVERVVRISGDAQAGARELAEALRMDDRATTLVLRVANSAAYGGAKRTSSLDDAVMRIGFRQTRSLVVGNGVLQSFGKDTRTVGFDRSGCWRHALATAILARQITDPGMPHSSDAAFIAGLVHDVGRVLLDEFCSAEFEDAVRYAVQQNVTLTAAEREVLQTSHVEVGTQALGKWNFPPEIVDAVKYHHDLPDADHFRGAHRSLCEVVHVADALARATGIGRGGVDTLIGTIAEGVLGNVGLSGGLPRAFWNGFADEFRAAHTFLGLPYSDAPSFTDAAGVALLWDEDPSPVSVLQVTLEAAGWRVLLADAAGVLPAVCAGRPPAAVVVRGRNADWFAEAAARWPPVVEGAPMVFVGRQGWTPAAGQAAVTEPYDRDLLLQLLPTPPPAAEAQPA